MEIHDFELEKLIFGPYLVNNLKSKSDIPIKKKPLLENFIKNIINLERQHLTKYFFSYLDRT